MPDLRSFLCGLVLRLAATIATSAVSSTLYGEAFDIEGSWQGVLSATSRQSSVNSSVSLRVVLNIRKGHQGLVATLDSPDQNARNLPVTSISFNNRTLKFASKPLDLSYKGSVTDEGLISGRLKQFGRDYRLLLSRHTGERINRPQTPNPPFPYTVEDVVLENKQLKTKLAGSLVLPREPKATVLLVSGSGQQDRDSQIAGHRPFRLIADHLARNQIASFRYDDRGVGESKGTVSRATSSDFADELVPVVRYLKSRVAKPVGVIGHSDGGVIGALLARQTDLDFLILMAAPALTGRQVLYDQNKAIFTAMGLSEADLQRRLDIQDGAFDLLLHGSKTELNDYLRDTWRVSGKDNMQNIGFPRVWRDYRNAINQPWLIYALQMNPKALYSELDIPMLALFGERDLQVDAARNAHVMHDLPNVEVITIGGANHLFQSAQTGLPSEYFTIEQTMKPEVLEQLSGWIEVVSTQPP